MYFLVVLAQFFLIVAIALAPKLEGVAMDFSLWPFAWHKVLGFCVCSVGFLVVIFSVYSMRGSFAVRVIPPADGSLITHGPFRYSRNPIYFGGILLCLGWSFSFYSMLALVLTTVLYFVLLAKIYFEERELQKKFGEDYELYRKNVSRILPFRRY